MKTGQMAEFCLECFNKYSDSEKLSKGDVIMDFDLCEECGEWKPRIIKIKRKNVFKYILLILKKFLLKRK